ncbi:MAG: hypothetical protein R3B84_11085 [Zavarzinella sp.]
MSDKSTRMILDALSKAVSEPAGFALFATKGEPGLFPANTTARFAADQAKNAGWLQVISEDTRGKQPVEICTITPAGREYLVAQSNPTQLLEDCVRVLELKSEELANIQGTLQHLETAISSLKLLVTDCISQLATDRKIAVPSRPTQVVDQAAKPMEALPGFVMNQLKQWAMGDRTSPDYPLPQLYQAVTTQQHISIGAYHDLLRGMHQQAQIYLHPWTGPLYTLPEPQFALLVGHEVAYYASQRN